MASVVLVSQEHELRWFRALSMAFGREMSKDYDWGIPLREGRDWVIDSYLEGRCCLFVCILNMDTPVGCVGLIRPQGGQAEVKRMYVPPIFRRNGFGRQLLNAVTALTDLAGLDCVAKVPTQEKGAILFYEANGFVKTIRPFNFFGDETIMVKR